MAGAAVKYPGTTWWTGSWAQGFVRLLEQMEESFVDTPCAAVREHMAVPAGMSKSRSARSGPTVCRSRLLYNNWNWSPPRGRPDGKTVAGRMRTAPARCLAIGTLQCQVS